MLASGCNVLCKPNGQRRLVENLKAGDHVFDPRKGHLVKIERILRHSVVFETETAAAASKFYPVQLRPNVVRQGCPSTVVSLSPGQMIDLNPVEILDSTPGVPRGYRALAPASFIGARRGFRTVFVTYHAPLTERAATLDVSGVWATTISVSAANEFSEGWLGEFGWDVFWG